MRRNHPRVAACAAIVVAAALAAGDALAARTNAIRSRGMTYDSLKYLPDFGGSWVPAGPPFEPGDLAALRATLPPEVRPEIAARYHDGRKQILSGALVERGYCEPPTFGGRLRDGAAGSLEFLFTPGRITIAVESGLVRRIYLRDAPPENALPESRGGTSIGHWEGRTLVVETSGLSPAATFLPGIALGHGAHVVERISLQDANTLRVETITTAPEILLAPLKSVGIYRRKRDRMFTDFDTCVKDDRSYDAKSRSEQFDATPQSDLPPPPAH